MRRMKRSSLIEAILAPMAIFVCKKFLHNHKFVDHLQFFDQKMVEGSRTQPNLKESSTKFHVDLVSKGSSF